MVAEAVDGQYEEDPGGECEEGAEYGLLYCPGGFIYVFFLEGLFDQVVLRFFGICVLSGESGVQGRQPLPGRWGVPTYSFSQNPSKDGEPIVKKDKPYLRNC